MKQSPFFAGILVSCLFGFSACQSSFLDDPLQTPGNFTVAAVPYVACLSWNPVPGVTTYRVRLNGEEVQDVTASPWRHERSVILGDTYTVSALYDGGRESHPAGPLAIGRFGSSYPLAPTEADNSQSIVSEPGAARPTQWYDADLSPVQTAHYYFIPIDTQYSTYRIWWNDSYQGNGTKNLDVAVSALEEGTGVSIADRQDSGWTNAGITITTGSLNSNTKHVVLKVEPWSIGFTGTYGIAYTYQ